MTKRPIFEWNADIGAATCFLEDKEGNVFYGSAFCHDDDEEFQSEKTGCTIALARATIDYLRWYRDQLRTELKTLRHFYSIIEQASDFDAKAKIPRMLRRQIHLKEDELDLVRSEIVTEQKELKQFIDDKDLFYRRMRYIRQEDKNKQEDKQKNQE